MPPDCFVAAFPTAPVLQAEDRMAVACPPAVLWRILETASPLPRWARMVRGLSAGGPVDRDGSARVWRLALGRHVGRVVERRTEAAPGQRLIYALEPEAGALHRFLQGLVFVFDLQDGIEGETVLRLRTYYPAGSPLGRLVRPGGMRRRFAALRLTMLRNVKRLAERAAARQMPDPGPFHPGVVVPPVALLLEKR